MRVPPAALLSALLLTVFPVPLSAGQTATNEEVMESFDITVKVKAGAEIPEAAAGKRPSRATDLCRGRLPSDFAREQFVTPLTESRQEARRQEDAGHDRVVALKNCLKEQKPHARHHKNLLQYHSAADKQRRLQADQGHHGYQAVAQSVPHNNEALT